jgi:hypothetical protein
MGRVLAARAVGQPVAALDALQRVGFHEELQCRADVGLGIVAHPADRTRFVEVTHE